MACFSRTADAQLESQVEAGAHRTMRTNDVPYTTLVTTVQPVAQGRPGEIGQIKRRNTTTRHVARGPRAGVIVPRAVAVTRVPSSEMR